MISNIISDLFNVLIFDKSSIPQNQEGDFIKLSGNLFLNKKLLDFYLEIKNKKQVQLSIFTSAPINKNDKLLKKYFNEFSDVFSTIPLGHSKNEPESFLLLSEKFGVDLENSFFIDDQKNHVIAAKKAGLPAEQFISNQEIINKLNNLCQL
jgi:FMN phosphatase YigB (HAD superfamily)